MSPRPDDDLEGLLKKSYPDVEYPRDLKTATRAEYVTRIRKNRRPGCPLFGTFVLLITFFTFRKIK